jgi:hypothetical protein
MDLWHHVLAVDNDRCTPWCTKGDVQDRSTFSNVDLLTAKHRVDSLPQPGFLRETDQQLQGFIGDAVL